jgi:phenylalanyl-tRNA synthetase beta chain
MAARDNLNRGERSLAYFEQGRVFCSDGEAPSERERLGVVLCGAWGDDQRLGFSHLKGVIEAVVNRSGFPEVEWRRGGGPWLDEAEGAVLASADGRPVGCAGVVSGEMAGRWDIKHPVYVAELDLGFADAEPPAVRFEALPRFPAVIADMTVEHATAISYAELVETVGELAGERVETVGLVARFAGKDLPPESVRTTLRLVYRHPERSLTQEEVNADQDDLRQRLAARLGVRFA